MNNLTRNGALYGTHQSQEIKLFEELISVYKMKPESIKKYIEEKRNEKKKDYEDYLKKFSTIEKNPENFFYTDTYNKAIIYNIKKAKISCESKKIEIVNDNGETLIFNLNN